MFAKNASSWPYDAPNNNHLMAGSSAWSNTKLPAADHPIRAAPPSDPTEELSTASAQRPLVSRDIDTHRRGLRRHWKWLPQLRGKLWLSSDFSPRGVPQRRGQVTVAGVASSPLGTLRWNHSTIGPLRILWQPNPVIGHPAWVSAGPLHGSLHRQQTEQAAVPAA